MNIFENQDYRSYVKWRIAQFTGKEKELKHMAGKTSMHMSQLSQVLNGQRNPTSDQAFRIASYLKLDSEEADYFMLLVSIERAEDREYKKFLKTRMASINKEKAGVVGDRNSDGLTLPKDTSQDIFFSSWYYSAIYLLTSIPGFGNIDSISLKLGLSRELTKNVLEFLVSAQLCTMQNGEYKTLIREAAPLDRPHLQNRHRSNWRFKAWETLFKNREGDRFFTQNLTASEEDIKKILELFADVEKKIDAILENTKPEKAICFNFDWFEI